MGLYERLKRAVNLRPGQGKRPGQNTMASDALVMLRNNPNLSEADIATALNVAPDIARPFINQAKIALLREQQMKPPSGPVPLPNAPPGTSQGQNDLTLVNYKPEEIMQQVENTLATVHFGMSKPAQFKEWVGETWSIIGPIVLLLGTAGEVFFFIWSQTEKNAAWWVAMSVLATVIVLEATFMVVSYKAETIRNRAESRPTGMTSLDIKKMSRYRWTWVTLGFGVGSGQVAFMLLAMGASAGSLAWLVTFAIVRTIMTLASDFYVAFIHEEKPTEAAEVIRSNELRAEAASKMLLQKTAETSIINNGVLEVRRVTAEAAIKEDNLRTELEMSKMENLARIESMRSQQENSTLMLRMGSSTLRAMFDPEMPIDQKQAQLRMLTMLMQGMKELPLPGQTQIEEEE